MKIVIIGGSGLIGKKVVTNDQSLIPGDNPRIGPTRFEDWLRLRTSGVNRSHAHAQDGQ